MTDDGPYERPWGPDTRLGCLTSLAIAIVFWGGVALLAQWWWHG